MKRSSKSIEQDALSPREIYETKIREHLKELPKDRVISLYLAIMWERDVAISQLAALGYSLGEKPRGEINEGR